MVQMGPGFSRFVACRKGYGLLGRRNTTLPVPFGRLKFQWTIRLQCCDLATGLG